MDDPAFWLQFLVTALIGLMGLYYSQQQLRLMNPANESDSKRFQWARVWPLVVMVALAASSWIPYLIHDDLPEFPDPKPYVRGYAASALAKQCVITVSGERFWKYSKHYKLAGACYFDDGLADVLDVPQLQVSRAYDIVKTNLALRVPWGPTFGPYIEEKHARFVTMVVLMLPIGVDPGSFSTLRQAKALKVRVVMAGSAGH
jgi:hypothetical protein